MREIAKALPGEDLIYYGDTARVPYGNKSADTIIRYSIENAQFLCEKGIKLLVIACNTASAFALKALQERFEFLVIGVVESGAKKAVSVTKNKRIAVLATQATILSGVYQKTITHLLPEADVFPVACPLFVPFVEENWVSHPACRLVVREYLKEVKEKEVDTVLLGCTHYPLLSHLIQEEMGCDSLLVDSATTCANQVVSVLGDKKLMSDKIQGSYRYFASDNMDHFYKLAKNFML